MISYIDDSQSVTLPQLCGPAPSLGVERSRPDLDTLRSLCWARGQLFARDVRVMLKRTGMDRVVQRGVPETSFEPDLFL
jgi:hypothetical protein